MSKPREALHEGSHPASAIGGLADDHPLTKHSRQQPGQGVAHGVVHRPLQAEAVGARDPVATIRADGLQSVASRRGARAAVVTPGRADQQVSSQGDGVVSRVLELEDASSIGVGLAQRCGLGPPCIRRETDREIYTCVKKAYATRGAVALALHGESRCRKSRRHLPAACPMAPSSTLCASAGSAAPSWSECCSRSSPDSDTSRCSAECFCSTWLKWPT